MPRQPIPLNVIAGDDTLDALLRLLATQGATLHVRRLDWSHGDGGEISGTVALIRNVAPAEPAPLQLHPEAFIAAAAPAARDVLEVGLPTNNPGATVVITEPEADAPPAPADESLDVHPADDDAQYRGPVQSAPTLTEADMQCVIVDRLATNPHLADVCTKLLKPLAQRGYSIDADREAFLTRTANEFADYWTTHYAKASALLLKGRHVFFPEQAEIYAALGKAARLESAAPAVAKAA